MHNLFTAANVFSTILGILGVLNIVNIQKVNSNGSAMVTFCDVLFLGQC